MVVVTAVAAVPSSPTTTAVMFRQFLNRTDFDSLLTPSKPRLQIIKWRALEVGAVFRVLDVVEIPTKGRSSVGVYIMLETESRETINVWITPIIHEELEKYDITQGTVFIKPLGTKQSNVTGREYFNFAIVVAAADEKNI